MLQKTITGIGFYELTDLLCGLKESEYITMSYPPAVYSTLQDADPDECNGYKVARCLLAGYPVTIYDKWAEDENEFHGNLPHQYIDYEMAYTITLQNVIDGLTRAANSTNYFDRRAVANIDAWEASVEDCERVIQYIVFGERVR